MKKNRLPVGEDETLDAFYHGRILVIQKKRGYRFAVDAPLLAGFIRTREGESLLELGAGSGIISLLLSLKPFRRLLCLEIQESLADLAGRNIAINKPEERLTIVRQDLRVFRSKQKYDVIFSNPPYIKKKTGFLSCSEEKSIAKHEIKCDIFDIMHLTGRLLKKNGRAYFIYPAARKEDFDRALERNGLKASALRWVFPRRGRPARWLLAECDRTSLTPKTLPPLFVYDENGRYTPEMKKIFAGENHA